MGNLFLIGIPPMEPSRQELLVENGELKRRLEELQVQAKELQAANQEILAAHKVLQERQEDLKRAQAVAHTGSWRLDVRQNELTWSEETHRIFGIPQGTPLSYETLLATVHPEDRDYVDRKWTAALAGEPYDIEHRIVMGNTVKWVRNGPNWSSIPRAGSWAAWNDPGHYRA